MNPKKPAQLPSGGFLGNQSRAYPVGTGSFPGGVPVDGAGKLGGFDPVAILGKRALDRTRPAALAGSFYRQHLHFSRAFFAGADPLVPFSKFSDQLD